jgi:hypothetical protein
VFACPPGDRLHAISRRRSGLNNLAPNATASATYPTAYSPPSHHDVQEDTDTLKHRIVKAESACETWRVAVDKEKYLEAYFMVEAPEFQLDERLRQSRL